MSYMNAALDIMQAHSVRRYEIDWKPFRSDAMSRLGDAQTTSDTYPALRQTIVALGDHHSQFVTPSGISQQGLPIGTGITAINAELLPPGVAYVYIPGFNGQGAEATAFADALRDAVEELDSNEPCGWVVDLRQNIGGNMWPMVAGIGPVLGEGDLGAFVTPDSTRSIWFYSEGAAGQRLANGNTSVMASVGGAPYTLAASELPPVAVLYGPYTASSGEAVAVAFRGRPLSRSFGEPTAGLSTANSSYSLSDGAVLVLTVATDADRTGQIYGAELQPDQRVSWTTIEPKSVYDSASAKAKDWLLTQTACEGGAG
jgi:C-terminal processing protease CtpA/Prc